MSKLSISKNTSQIHDLVDYFAGLDRDFIGNLSKRVNIPEYVKKLHYFAETIEIWERKKSKDIIVALIAFYINLEDGKVFISHISVLQNRINVGLATKLLSELLKNLELDVRKRTWEISLEVDINNEKAINLYKKFCFTQCESIENRIRMNLTISTMREF